MLCRIYQSMKKIITSKGYHKRLQLKPMPKAKPQSQPQVQDDDPDGLMGYMGQLMEGDKVLDPSFFDNYMPKDTCDACQGEGQKGGLVCQQCGGDGEVEVI